MSKNFVAAAAMTVLYGAAAQAATVHEINGVVLANVGGAGYRQIAGSVTLQKGDTVIANPGASAKFVCDDGSVIPVVSGKVVSDADCGVVTGAVDASAAGGSGWGNPLLSGGLAVAGGVGLIVGLGGGGGSSSSDGGGSNQNPPPASP